MNEKEMLAQNVNGALPTAQKLNRLEGEINQLTMEIEQKKKFGCGWALLFSATLFFWFIGLTSFCIGGGDGILLGLINVALGAVPIVLLVLRLLRIQECKRKIVDLERQRTVFQNDASLAWLPAEYRTGSCLNAIISYVQNGRADSMKEALNLLENELHQQRMENAAVVGAYYGARSGQL